MDTEALMELAKNNEAACYKELEEILKKYSCGIHFAENKVDGTVVGGGIFFRFNPNMALGKGNKGG